MTVNPATGCACPMCTGPLFDDEPVRPEPAPQPGRPLLRLVVDNTR